MVALGYSVSMTLPWKVEAVQHAETILNELINLHENIDHTFDEIFEKSASFGIH